MESGLRQHRNGPSRWPATGLVPDLTLTGGIYYVGRQAIDALNENVLAAYTTHDGGASYTIKVADHAVVFSVNGQNIANRRYFNSSQGLMLSERLPSTVKFSISTSLGART
jgi:iron complex outermembrane recepter protein